MSLKLMPAAQALAELDQFDAILDARTESEYALDHLPGAENWPTLRDEERIIVGTLYKQVSPFEARKRGGVLAARNIANNIEAFAMDKPRQWAPLAYCWRGGKRSGSIPESGAGPSGIQSDVGRGWLQSLPCSDAGRHRAAIPALAV